MRISQEKLVAKKKNALLALDDLSKSYPEEIYFPTDAIFNRALRIGRETLHQVTLTKVMEEYTREGIVKKAIVLRGAIFYLNDDSKSLLEGSRVGYRINTSRQQEIDVLVR